jgi:hypothetical protein
VVKVSSTHAHCVPHVLQSALHSLVSSLLASCMAQLPHMLCCKCKQVVAPRSNAAPGVLSRSSAPCILCVCLHAWSG